MTVAGPRTTHGGTAVASRSGFLEGVVLELEETGALKHRYWLQAGDDIHLNSMTKVGSDLVVAGSLGQSSSWVTLAVRDAD